MFLKVVGSLLLIVSGTAFGYVKSKKLNNRVKFLEEYIKFLLYIETQIRYSSCSLARILEQYNSSSMIGFIKCCLENIEKDYTFIDAWNESIKKIPSDLGLKNSDINKIKEFGNGLGVSDIEGQISHCKLNRELMNSKLNEALEEKQKKSKLYQMLGISSGIIVALILI